MGMVREGEGEVSGVEEGGGGRGVGGSGWRLRKWRKEGSNLRQKHRNEGIQHPHMQERGGEGRR